MKKLTMPLRGYHVLLLLLLTLFTSTFSFGQTIITGTASSDNKKLPAGLAVTTKGTHNCVIINTRIAWSGWFFRADECCAYCDQWASHNGRFKAGIRDQRCR